MKHQVVFHGDRPTKTRKISRKYASYRGQLLTTKLHLVKEFPPISYPYESEIEKEAYHLLDHDKNCREMIIQPKFKLKYENGDEFEYAADCWAAFHDSSSLKWQIVVFEIKSAQKEEKIARQGNRRTV